MAIRTTFKSAIAAVALLSLVACSDDEAAIKPAPIGDLEALKTLAQAYTKVSDSQLSISPAALPGDERRRFLVKVFAEAGYDYSATLHELAKQGLDKDNKHQRDLAELLLMPHRHQSRPMDVADIYESQELMDVAALERELKK